ncbi:MAG: hypothetical protein J7K31_03675 [Candidatus Aenigmarchaeota archaeon]|nr:hypothetical protein [Candidatus Aenigmarchaeota archaeon]
MKKMALFVAMLVLISPAFAAMTESPNLNIYQQKYDPYPVEAGKYFTLFIEVSNNATETAKNVTLILEPEYPFSLDKNEQAERFFPEIPGIETVLLQYKIRVDSNAVKGWNELKLKYHFAGGAWVTRKFRIYIGEIQNKAELEFILDKVDPTAYPTGTSTISVEVANVAPGSAYYTIIEASCPVAKITPEKSFIGTLDADDFDTIDLEAKFDNVTPGKYPINFIARYKDSDNKRIVTNGTIYVELVSKEEAMKSLVKPTPWYMYVVYAIVVLLILKFFIIGWVRKIYAFFRPPKRKR